MAKPFNLKSFIIATLRKASYRFPARNEAMKLARIERGFYKCAMCGEAIAKKDLKLDHKIPVVDPRTGFTTWDDYINRMFPDVNGWQCLHRVCHDSKTAVEREIRKKYRKPVKKVDKKNKKV